MLRRSALNLIKNVSARASLVGSVRSMSHYPINDDLFGLTEEEKSVSSINSLPQFTEFSYHK